MAITGRGDGVRGEGTGSLCWWATQDVHRGVIDVVGDDDISG